MPPPDSRVPYPRHPGGCQTRREVALEAGTTAWLPAQEHHGENTGDTDTHVLFVELKTGPGGDGAARGPVSPGPE